MPNGLVTRRRAAAATLAVAGLLAAACGGDDATTDEPPEAAQDQEATDDPAEQQATEQESASDEQASADGLCATVVAVDLTQAFDGTLEFGEPSESSVGESCIVPVEGAEGEGLIVQVTTEATYEEKAKFEQQGVPFTTVDGLGAEAFIVNEADLNVLLDDGSAVVVAISAFFVDSEPPSAQTLQDGLTTVAEAVVAGR